MKGIDDKTLTRNQKLAYYMFLCSEETRHEHDIVMLKAQRERLIQELKMTKGEINRLWEASRKYVKF